MTTSRIAVRSARCARLRAPLFRQDVRFASQDAGASTGAGGGGMGSAVTGGLVGGFGVFVAGYAWYHFSGARTAVSSAQQASQYLDDAKERIAVSFKEGAPDANEALDAFKQTAQKYASFIPGGKDYVDRAFNDLNKIREKHGDEVDKITREAYEELRSVSKKGISVETAVETWNILSKHLQRLASLAGDAGQDIIDNHPQLKEKVGSSWRQLQQMGDKVGPEAKKMVDDTWSEINDILKQGISMDTADRVKKLVEEKLKKIREMSDGAWKKGMDQLKPMLDKSPQLKQVFEENEETLKNADVGEVVEKVKNAASSGDKKDLEQYVKSLTEKSQ